MKFMKLGSKPDYFQTDGNNVRYVATELPSDVIVYVGDVKFCLHKFPLLSKSACLQKLVAAHGDEVHIDDIPGGPAAVEICAKFCYGMTVTLNAYNVVAARCAAEYLGMHENIEKGNLIYKIEIFLNSSILHSWKDSIIVLQTTKTLLPLSEDLKVVSHCIDSIASKASTNTSKVDWSYTYNRKKLSEETGNDPNWNGVRSRTVPQDWWVEDLCELEVGLYKRVITKIISKERVLNEVIGEALKAYAIRRLPGFSKGTIQRVDIKSQSIVDAIVWLLPAEKGSVSCSFLLKLLKASLVVELGELVKGELIMKIGQKLEEASVKDLLIHAQEGETTIYNVDIVQRLVEEFRMQDHNEVESLVGHELQEVRKPGFLSDASKLMVAKLVDEYLAEIAIDPNLPMSKFMNLAEVVSACSRPVHDGLYRAIDIYLKEHPGISKSERKRICRLMDCKKLSIDACTHAVQNERLPLRVVVQVLFFEQVRAAATSGSSTPDLPKPIKNLNHGSSGSSKSASNTEEDWDAAATTEELKALKGEVTSLRLGIGGEGSDKTGGESRYSVDKAGTSKLKGLLMSRRIFTGIWSNKGVRSEFSSSDSSGSPGSASQEDAKFTPTRKISSSVS